MSGVLPRRITLPKDRATWQSARNARRAVLEKVRARRRLMIERRAERVPRG
jgi:hypothetical protein